MSNVEKMQLKGMAFDCTSTQNYTKVDEAMTNVIRAGMIGDGVLNAYKARKKCYKVCKMLTFRPDYKEYVQNFMHKNFPNEYQKAVYGPQYFWSLVLVVVLSIIALFSFVMLLSDPGDEELLLGFCPSLIVSCIGICYFVRKIKKASKLLKACNKGE
jgi:hypothetical protein